MLKKILCVGGARPNFMKLAPLMRSLLKDSCFQPLLVHTGQHYDELMSDVFIRDLGLPEPTHSLGVGSGSHAQQTAEIMKRFEPVVEGERPDAVLVVGDVNSTAACALVAAKLQVPVVHAEAGLRSFDRSMPEEINRVVTDALTDLFLVSEESGVENLYREGVPEQKICLVGNLMIDSMLRHLERARKSEVLQRLNLEKPYGVVTLHRPANVDRAANLLDLMNALQEISSELKLVFPVHVRTRAFLTGLGTDFGDRIVTTPPMGYLDFLSLLSNSAAVFTDSGGIQEETTVLGIPCFTLRCNTERPATIRCGTNILAGTTRKEVLQCWQKRKETAVERKIPPLWDGKAGDRCADAIRLWLQASQPRSKTAVASS